MNVYHQAVMAREVVDILTDHQRKGGFFVDATLGGGGHSEALLQCRPDIHVTGFDQDAEAIRASSTRLAEFGDRFQVVHSNFCKMGEWIEAGTVDGVIMDLGVSSHQLNSAERGFSFQSDGPLDMRMNSQNNLTASEIVNGWGESDLSRIFWELGEERHSRRIARAIVNDREHRTFRTTRELADLVVRVIPRGKVRWKIHPATRVFQALRLAVNDELAALSEGLEHAWQCMKVGGRLVVISFHSLEDRIVKVRFRKWWKEEEIGEVLSKKPRIPSEEETQRNPRARSAKLRAVEKWKEAIICE